MKMNMISLNASKYSNLDNVAESNESKMLGLSNDLSLIQDNE